MRDELRYILDPKDAYGPDFPRRNLPRPPNPAQRSTSVLQTAIRVMKLSALTCLKHICEECSR